VKMLEMYKALMDFELAGKDVVNGIEVYVLKGSMKIGMEESDPAMEALRSLAPGMDSFMSDITMRVGIEDGFICETSMGEINGEPIMVMRMNNVKLDVEIDESTFRYEPPAGITVMDMTEMITGNFEELLEDEGDKESE
jgi:outer membrane lipoprotein-sorting protein